MPDNDSVPVSWWRAARRHPRRAYPRNLESVTVSAREREQLLAAGIGEDFLQRYAAWRRSSLLVVVAPTLLAALVATAATVGQEREGLSRLGRALTLISTLALLAMPVSALLAGRSWTSLRRSQRWVFAGWAAAFLPPFAIALVPLGWWFEATGPPATDVRHQVEVRLLDVLDGLYIAFALLPAALSILPGLLRACLRVKTLLPATILPGWFLMAAAPFYLLLWVVGLVVLNHLAGSPLLILGVLLLVGAPMLYVRRADLFVRPLPAGGDRAVARVRRAATTSATAGSLLLVAYLLTKQVFGLYLVGLDPEASLTWILQNRAEMSSPFGEALARARSLYWAGDISLGQMVVQYFGRSLFMTTVFADWLVRMNLSMWREEQRFGGTPDGLAYGAAMTELERLLARKRS